MYWKELEPDIKIGNLTQVLRHRDCLSTIHALSNFIHGIRIYALQSVFEIVMTHVRSNRKEVGGLLLGKVWQQEKKLYDTDGGIIVLYDAVPSVSYHHTSVSLKMDSEIWSLINQRLSNEMLVIGWYHSHPNLGAFFSGTDRSTQRAFFNNKYSLGWVIDPFKEEQKIFIGKNSEEYKSLILGINEGLEVA